MFYIILSLGVFGWVFWFQSADVVKMMTVAGLGDVLGQTTSPWAGPVHGWAGLGSNPLFEKNQPMARPTRYSFTLKRIGFEHRVYDSCTNVADQ